ncbi:MAG: type I-E CRISPR-associated protein Cse2/CasB [Propionibacteriaceae bacterium]|jgi:CRISPR system Cascade subunit CasB|nr:type I-E CRISPR-associated protein Cse2/CasB [Propionibacteriaceae bacterium]
MTETSHISPGRELAEFVGRRVARLQTAYLDPTRSEGKAQLAELRKSAAEPGGSPNTWFMEFEGFPGDLVGTRDEPYPAERAAHLAFTLYAIHQQSQNTAMHQFGREFGLGRAVARLQRQQSTSDPTGKLPTRFAALGTASDFDEISHYARQLITQLRAAAIPLDYGILAAQFLSLQYPSSAGFVRRAWGRDFAGTHSSSSSKSTESNQKEA